MKPTENIDAEIQQLIEALYLKYGYDLGHYAKSFIKRRILHRLSISGIAGISEMQQKALADPGFFEALLLDISITVTEMFRDPSFYSALRREVIPYLKTYPFIKIWAAGCATGEEVYSLSILLKEEGLYRRSLIYATDFNDVVIKKAKDGIYPILHLQKYTSNYQKAGGIESFADYYTADSEYVIMNKSLKENIVFSNHNLITDGVFNEMNLILCRNVLIYFDRDLQNRVIKLFYDSLCHNGFLCLGSKESLRPSMHKHDFEEVASAEKIYRKKEKIQALQTENSYTAYTDHTGLQVSHMQPSDREATKYEAVVIGASAGGIKALSVILSSLPSDFPISVILVQHQHPSASGYLADLLSKTCLLHVKEAEDKENIKPGVVYIAPPNYHLMIEDDKTFSISLFERVSYAIPSIDVLFETAADVYKEKVIGIILTGANDDGSGGLRKIKDLGGFSVVQDPATAEFELMPKAAIAAAKADLVLTVERIGRFLANIGQEETADR
ncbi:MAG: hypothetical protein HY957_04695 [Nitrospirae bacterium]|nr:hypothetical protein [Nitrospirota bacterium]